MTSEEEFKQAEQDVDDALRVIWIVFVAALVTLLSVLIIPMVW